MLSISFQEAKLLFGGGLIPISVGSPTTLNDVFLSPSRLHIMKLTATFRSFANAPKNLKFVTMACYTTECKRRKGYNFS